jgi:hypothetical protein
MDLYIPFPDLTPSTIMSFSAATGLPQRSARLRRDPPGTSTDDPFARSGTHDHIEGTYTSMQAGPSGTEEFTEEVEDVFPSDLVGYRFRRPEDPGRRMRTALEGIVEDLSDQEERVYRAEVCLIPSFLGDCILLTTISGVDQFARHGRRRVGAHRP